MLVNHTLPPEQTGDHVSSQVSLPGGGDVEALQGGAANGSRRAPAWRCRCLTSTCVVWNFHDSQLWIAPHSRRFYLEVEARKRFRVGREWEQDGYRVVVPLPLADAPLPENGPEAEELAELVKDVEAAADAWVSRVS